MFGTHLSCGLYLHCSDRTEAHTQDERTTTREHGGQLDCQSCFDLCLGDIFQHQALRSTWRRHHPSQLAPLPTTLENIEVSSSYSGSSFDLTTTQLSWYPFQPSLQDLGKSFCIRSQPFDDHLHITAGSFCIQLSASCLSMHLLNI